MQQKSGPKKKMTEKNKPCKHVRVGNVSATVWENEAKDTKQKFYTAKLQRSYKDDKDDWQNTDTLGLGDIPKAVAALQAVYVLFGVKVED